MKCRGGRGADGAGRAIPSAVLGLPSLDMFRRDYGPRVAFAARSRSRAEALMTTSDHVL